MRRHQLLPFIAIVTIFFTSCLGPKKVNKWADAKYGDNLKTTPKTKSDYLTITSPFTTRDSQASTDSKETKNVLPLLFYWQFDYVNTCELNPKIPVNTLITTIPAYANSKGLKQKLNGQKVELSIDAVPSQYEIYDRGHLIWLILYAYGWDVITFRPDKKDLVVSYKITKDDAEVKKGVITIPNADKVLKLKIFQAIRKANDKYLDQYDENIKTLGKKVVDQLLTEL